MIAIWRDNAFVIPSELSEDEAMDALAEHLEEEITAKHSIGGEHVEFRRSLKHTNEVRHIGPVSWHVGT